MQARARQCPDQMQQYSSYKSGSLVAHCGVEPKDSFVGEMAKSVLLYAWPWAQ